MKLRNKLILSCAALAACATTMVSTTFAWYTSNTNVDASGIAGTSQANGESLLLISNTGLDGSFSNSVDLQIDTKTLVPVEYTENSQAAPTFKSWTPNGSVNGGVADTAYVKFDLYFRGVNGDGTGVPVNLKTLTLTNSAPEKLPQKDVLHQTGLGTTPAIWDYSTNGAQYTVDILRTLNIAYFAQKIEAKPLSPNTTFASQGCLNPEALIINDVKDKLVGRSGWNAHDYYNAITGKTISTEDTSSTSKATALTVGGNTVNFGTTPASTNSGNSLKVTFYVYINGWDLACFDAVQGQTFTLSLGFTSEETTLNAA